MPPKGGLTRETPTGRAVGNFLVWHNYFDNFEEVACFWHFQEIEDIERDFIYAYEKKGKSLCCKLGRE